VELIARDIYFCDEIDRRIFKVMYKAATMERQLAKLGKAKHPGLVAKLYAYRQGVTANLARNLQALGLEKVPPKTKSLDELLAEDEKQEEQGDTAPKGET
jgi:hypothetical protein